MALVTIPNVRVKGITACVPPWVEENLDIPVFNPGEAERVIAQTGIERKHVVDEGVCVSDLCLKAGERLMAELGWERETIDAIGFVSLAPDYLEPPTACVLQGRLNLSEDCFALDMSHGCPGWVNGFFTLASLVSHGDIKRAILFNGDTPTQGTSPLDKESRPLFGDAGIATALEFDTEAPVIEFHLGTRGKDFKAIWKEYGGRRNPITPEALEYKEIGEHIVRRGIDATMDGMSVFAFGMTMAPKSVNTLCEHYGINKDGVDKFIFHQANQYMNERIRKKLKLEPERAPYSLKDYGNTGSASIPLTLVTQCHEEYATKEMETVACAFGVGLAWGSVHFRTNKMVCPEVIIY